MLTINNSDYFLLEFPPDFIFPGTRQFIYNVMQDGYIPIICHVERNRVFRQNPLLLYQFLQMGALSQVTAGSFRGDFGSEVRAAAIEFVKSNMAHVIASDSHHSRYRQPQMSFVYKELKETVDPQQLDMLTTGIPSAIINNEAIPDTGPMRDPSRRSSVFDFFTNLFQKQ
jgi:protein-tyrosine phosphatase